MRRLAPFLAVLVVAAAPARAGSVDEDSTCGPGGTMLAAFVTSALLTSAGGAVADATSHDGRALTFAAWGALVPPLVTAPLVSWMSPGPNRWQTTMPASMLLRLAVLAPLVAKHALDPSFSNSDVAGWGTILASIAGTALEFALEYRQPASHFGRGSGLRLAFATALGQGGGVGSGVQYVFLNEGSTFQHGPAISLDGIVSLPDRNDPSSLEDVIVDVDWRGEWHRPDALGPFGAVLGGPGLGLVCRGDFCSPFRISLGGEVGYRFPMNDTWRLEALVQSRVRFDPFLSLSEFPTWATSFMLGVI